jgi:hypothetical protein
MVVNPMNAFTDFLGRLAAKLGLPSNIPEIKASDESEVAANILNEINSFLYQQKKGLPSKYISEFHRYWEQEHEKILAPRIADAECLLVAQALEDIYRNHSPKVQLDTLDLDREAIANVRFFTAIQDFNIDIQAKGNPFEFYRRRKDCFDPKRVLENDLLVDQLLNFLQAESQRDKRKPWMLSASKLLVERYRGSAFNINEEHKGDVLEIVNALTSEERYGFSTKKAHMFLRDMADLGVWQYRNNVETLDVMSDKNTMRVGLRTGILQFRIPLLASYLDIYGYQYELTDRMNRAAWRRVWHMWNELPHNHRPPTPASIDYFIFRLGKLACKRNKRACPPEQALARKKFDSLIQQDKLLFTAERYCVFEALCTPERKMLNPPNSISIEGRTGWKSGKINEGGGGGISS